MQAGWEPQDWRDRQGEELSHCRSQKRSFSQAARGFLSSHVDSHWTALAPLPTCQLWSRPLHLTLHLRQGSTPWPSHPLNHHTLVSVRLWRPIMKNRDFSWKPGKLQVTFYLLIRSRTCPSSTLCVRHWHPDSLGFQTGCEIVVVHIQHPV